MNKVARAKKKRLSCEERREAIVQAVRNVFAEKGFHGTTTREAAEAAGVSEALLFKHFPSKEALYAAMHQQCCMQQAASDGRSLMDLEPSTATLVVLVHFLMTRAILGKPNHGAQEDVFNRLMLRSLMEDGAFARILIERLASGFIPKLEECIRAAAAAGDVGDSSVLPSLRGWFAHHLCAMLAVFRLAPPMVPYGVPREKLVEQAVWFTLQGMGLTAEAIRRHYKPRALSLLDQ